MLEIVGYHMKICTGNLAVRVQVEDTHEFLGIQRHLDEGSDDFSGIFQLNGGDSHVPEGFTDVTKAHIGVHLPDSRTSTIISNRHMTHDNKCP